jgi:hypothetical protein
METISHTVPTTTKLSAHFSLDVCRRRTHARGRKQNISKNQPPKVVLDDAKNETVVVAATPLPLAFKTGMQCEL